MKLPPPDPFLREARALMKRLEPDPAHAVQVARIADRLYQLLEPVHLLDKSRRRMLSAAALLHDIGWSEAPDGKAHHKHSSRLIRRQAWNHLDAGDIELLAQIARYHRRKLPTKKHKPFARLDGGGRRQVSALAALLRMADALDRSHRSLLREIDAVITPKGIVLTAHAHEPAHDEEFAFLKKRDLFEEHFEISIQLDIKLQ